MLFNTRINVAVNINVVCLLQPSFHLGDCWAMEDSSGYATVKVHFITLFYDVQSDPCTIYR